MTVHEFIYEHLYLCDEEQLKNSEVTQLTAFFLLCLEEKLKYKKNGVPWSSKDWEKDFPGGVHKKDGCTLPLILLRRG